MRGTLQGQSWKRYKTNQVTGLSAQVGFATAGTVVLSWVKPTDANFKGLVIRRKTGSYPTSPTDGTSVYDSNDAVPTSTITVTGLTDGTLYYFRAFAYSYIGAVRQYNTGITESQVTATPLQLKGMQTFTGSGTFTVPVGVTSIDVFLVGGGGSGGKSIFETNAGGGGGGGYTKTQKNIAVTPGQNISVIVGAGAAIDQTSPGGTSSCLGYTANGGRSVKENTSQLYGGAGGNGGGGGGGYNTDNYQHYNGGAGGSNGASGATGLPFVIGGAGQGTTTKAFDDASLTAYAGGGGGGGKLTEASGQVSARPGLGGVNGGGLGGYLEWNSGVPYIVPGAPGTPNTGGGGGGSSVKNAYIEGSAGAGGSGIVIIRWGY